MQPPIKSYFTFLDCFSIREETHQLFKNYSDIYVTQIHRNNLYAPVPFGFNHVVFFNAQNLRLLPLRREVKAIMPLVEYKKLEPRLKQMNVGEILIYRNQFFLCADKSIQSRYNVKIALKVR